MFSSRGWGWHALKAGVLSNVQVPRYVATQNLPAAASATVNLASKLDCKKHPLLLLQKGMQGVICRQLVDVDVQVATKWVHLPYAVHTPVGLHRLL
jgi:hypothetical protein